MSYEETELKALDTLSTDALHGLLAHHRQCRVLVCLDQHDQLALADLADEIAAREHDEPIAEIPEGEVLRIYSSLWHAHIPRLEDANVVEYDQDRDIVSLGPNADQLQQYLSIDESGEDAK